MIIKLLLFPTLLKLFSIYNESHALEPSFFYHKSMFLCSYLTIAPFLTLFFPIYFLLIHSYKHSLFIYLYSFIYSLVSYEHHIFNFLFISFECLLLHILVYLCLLGFHVFIFMANKLYY